MMTKSVELRWENALHKRNELVAEPLEAVVELWPTATFFTELKKRLSGPDLNDKNMFNEGYVE